MREARNYSREQIAAETEWDESDRYMYFSSLQK